MAEISRFFYALLSFIPLVAFSFLFAKAIWGLIVDPGERRDFFRDARRSPLGLVFTIFSMIFLLGLFWSMFAAAIGLPSLLRW